jgi:hypothetical protein
MIYFKIYFTLILVTLIVTGVTGVTSLLMISDDKRRELWFRIASISWITLLVLFIGGTLTAIWFFD